MFMQQSFAFLYKQQGNAARCKKLLLNTLKVNSDIFSRVGAVAWDGYESEHLSRSEVL